MHGEPFTLHPPLAFLVTGAVVRLAGLADQADLLPVVLALRPVAAVFGALVVVLTTLTVRAAGAQRAALVAGSLLALDPFGLQFDGRLMLESTAQAFTVLTVLACVLAARGAPGAGRGWVVLAAVAGSATFATKETFGLVVLGALALLLLLGVGLPRRRTGAVLAGTLVGYAAVNALVVATVGAGTWWASRTSGLARLLGTEQTTGFNAPDSQVSLWSRVAANALQYGASYCVLGLGGLTGLVLLALTRRRVAGGGRLLGAGAPRGRAVLAAWAVAACCYLAYAVGFGSLEEQMFYIPLAPCAVLCALLVDAALASPRGRQRSAAAVLVAATLLLQGGQYVRVRTEPDDAYLHLLSWIGREVPGGSVLAMTEETGEFLVRDQRVGQWGTLAELRSHHVDYVVISTALVAQGYGFAEPGFVAALHGVGVRSAVFTGRTDTALEVWDVRAYTGGSR
nr:phospholipid carrier-dependent glycosyltransferase [Kineococcus vitellinus]